MAAATMGDEFRVRWDAEVRQAPSATSNLFHVAAAGKLVKLLGAPVNVPGVGFRAPLMPRGWIDVEALEPAHAAASGGSHGSWSNGAAAGVGADSGTATDVEAARSEEEVQAALLNRLMNEAGDAAPEEAQKDEARLCPGGCGYLVTWHPTHCCNACPKNGTHGRKCDSRLPQEQKRQQEALGDGHWQKSASSSHAQVNGTSHRSSAAKEEASVDWRDTLADDRWHRPNVAESQAAGRNSQGSALQQQNWLKELGDDRQSRKEWANDAGNVHSGKQDWSKDLGDDRGGKQDWMSKLGDDRTTSKERAKESGGSYGDKQDWSKDLGDDRGGKQDWLKELGDDRLSSKDKAKDLGDDHGVKQDWAKELGDDRLSKAASKPLGDGREKGMGQGAGKGSGKGKKGSSGGRGGGYHAAGGSGWEGAGHWWQEGGQQGWSTKPDADHRGAALTVTWETLQQEKDMLRQEKAAAEWYAEAQRLRADALQGQLLRAEAKVAMLQQASEGGSTPRGQGRHGEEGSHGVEGSPPLRPIGAPPHWQEGRAAYPSGNSASSWSGWQEKKPLFTGSIIQMPDEGAENVGIVECQEAAALHGSALVRVPAALLPMGANLGMVLCLELADSSDCSAAAQAEATAACSAGDARAASGRSLVGTLKAFSLRRQTERIGWISCLATSQLYSADVYAHGSMVEGFNPGDVLSFKVHVNAKGQPQAETGSVTRLGSSSSFLAGPRRKASGDAADEQGSPRRVAGAGMDCTISAPGRVLLTGPGTAPVATGAAAAAPGSAAVALQ